ncbi:MAG: PEP-CTERM sorting domain-containing protein [Planctomycetota bacterium]
MRLFTLCLALFFAVCSNPLSAGLALNFSNDNGTSFADSFSVQTGEKMTIGVFLQQTAPDTILNDEGIVSWGFDIAPSSAMSGTLASPNINADFDFENHNVATAGGYQLEYAQSSGTGVMGDSILLASFEFTSSAAGISEFTIGDRLVGSGPGNVTWLTPSFNTLDEQIFGAGAGDTYQFSVSSISAVPEPSSFLLLSGLGGYALLRRPRRKQLAKRHMLSGSRSHD